MYSFLLAWFEKLKYIQDWLYQYFAAVIHLLIHNKDGDKALVKPPIFMQSKPYALPTFWIHSPEPAMSLYTHWFEPTILFCPRIFLWLVHFFVNMLACPNCGELFQKNSALPPCCVVDLEALFYIIAWAYYCHHSVLHHIYVCTKFWLSS